MKAVVLQGAGGPEVLAFEDIPRPGPGPRDLLVRVGATSVNRVDIQLRKGAAKFPPVAYKVPGLDVAGHVEAVGADVTGWQQGDPVCGLITSGGYAEYAILPASMALPIPKGLSVPAAAAVPEVFATAWDNLNLRGQLGAGDVALVQGGTSGVGSAAVQLGVWAGATVFTTASTERKLEACRSLGAHEVINYVTEDFAERVRSLTGGRGVDVILDIVGGDQLNRNIDALAYDGRLVIIATMDGDEGTLNMRTLRSKRAVVTGSTLRDRSECARAALMQDLHTRLWPAFESGVLAPVVHDVLPLEQVADAHRMLEAREHIGKVVLTVT